MDELKENYEKKVGLLNGILSIAADQGRKLAADDMEGLMQDIEQRQKLLYEIDRIDEMRHSILKLAAYKNKGELGSCSYTDIKILEDNIKELLIKIQQIDSANQSIAQGKLEGYRKQIKAIQQSKKRVDSYVPHYAIHDGIYINAKK